MNKPILYAPWGAEIKPERKIISPYIADFDLGGKRWTNQQVLEINKKTIIVQLDNGDIVKRHRSRHHVVLGFVRPE